MTTHLKGATFIIVAFLLNYQAKAQLQLPHVEMPSRYALLGENIEYDNNREVSRDKLAIIRDGDRWYIELAAQNNGVVNAYRGVGTNVIDGSTLDERIPKAFIYTFDEMYKTLNDSDCVEFLGVTNHASRDCWAFITTNSEKVLINIADHLPVLIQDDSVIENYISLLLTDHTYEELLSSTSNTTFIINQQQ